MPGGAGLPGRPTCACFALPGLCGDGGQAVPKFKGVADRVMIMIMINCKLQLQLVHELVM